MKKIIAVAAMLLVAFSFASAQDAAAPTAATAPAVAMSSASAGRYTVWSDAGSPDAQSLAETLGGLFAVYNEYFRFDETSLKAPLTVRKFSTKDAFDAYLTKVIGETKDDFVYLHYPTAERSELVVFEKASSDEFNASLAHQAFVQFLKAFVPEPPLWIREGFAVFFERAAYSEEAGTVVYAENQAWLETVKLLVAQDKTYAIADLMTLTADQARESLDVFYPEAWAVVSFFINSDDRRYNRFIWDAIAQLKPEATLDENQAAVRDFFLRWHSAEAADADFTAYLAAQKTFAELVTDGVRLYGDKDLDGAGKLFIQALAKNPSSYIPHYYLGLIAYAKADYAGAEAYYLKALDLGSDAPITNYALGINAFASRRFDEARIFLQKAADGAPERYQAKVAEILARMETGG